MPDSDKSNVFQPTIIDSPAKGAEVQSDRNLDVSKARVGFVDRTGPRFADETAVLLRDRLTAASLVMAVILTVAFVRNLFLSNVPLVGLRGAVLLVLFGSYAILQSSLKLSLIQVRCAELVVFGGLLVQLALMMSATLRDSHQGTDSPRHQTCQCFCG